MSYLKQDYIVYQDREIIRARGDIDAVELASSPDAAEVIQKALDALDD